MANRSDNHVARALAEPVDLVPYDPDWSGLFDEEAARLRRLLPPDTLGRIEHIGSTAVPGLPAKPIVDMLVEVPDLQTVRTRIAPILERHGYEFFWRPTSPGDADMAYAWFLRRDADGRRTHHVHMVPPGSRYRDCVAFRDRLIADPAAAAAYAALKRRAAARHAGDRRAYARAKGAFIGKLLDAGR